ALPLEDGDFVEGHVAVEDELSGVAGLGFDAGEGDPAEAAAVDLDADGAAPLAAGDDFGEEAADAGVSVGGGADGLEEGDGVAGDDAPSDPIEDLDAVIHHDHLSRERTAAVPTGDPAPSSK